MGHPLGATGAMILGTLIDELHRRQLRYGLTTLCVGGATGPVSCCAGLRKSFMRRSSF
jgi:acetyl-CoA acetyltransferase